ncbi:MAG: ribbon-helix-helix protein, CopG family [Nitrospirota bacterium]
MRETQHTGEGPKHGRPRRMKKEARAYRIAAFVTGLEVEGLERIAQEEGRSRSDVIHRIIAQHLQNLRPTERN